MSYIVSSNYLKKEFSITTTTASQDLTTSFAVVDGSTITYTPDEKFGTEVMYEYNTLWAYKDNSTKIIFRLVEYNTGTSAWDEISGSYITIKSTKRGAGQINYKYILQKWTGSKQLRLECKDSTTSLEGYLHTDHSRTILFDPIVECVTV